MAFVTPISITTCTIPRYMFTATRPQKFFNKCNCRSTIPNTLKMSASSAPSASTSLSASVGTSIATVDADAVSEAIRNAQVSLSGSVTHAIISCTVDRDTNAIIDTARALLPPGTPIHGATTCGAVLTNKGPLSNGIGVLLLCATPGSVAVASQSASENENITSLTASVVSSAAAQLSSSMKPAHILIHAAPGTEEAALKGVGQALPNVKVFGGSVADNTVEGNWKVLSDKGAFSNGVSVMVIAETVPFGACLFPPYQLSAKGAVVTKAQGRLIHELDGRRAADVLKEWVVDKISTQAKEGGNIIVECAAFPLGVEKVAGGFVGIHAAEITSEGSVMLFAEVHVGERIVVLRNMGEGPSASAAAVGLEQAYQIASKEAGTETPAAGMIIYCGGLSIAVGDDLGKSLVPMEKKPPMLGITAFGEQGNIKGCNVHSNLAVGVAVFGQG